MKRFCFAIFAIVGIILLAIVFWHNTSDRGKGAELQEVATSDVDTTSDAPTRVDASWESAISGDTYDLPVSVASKLTMDDRMALQLLIHINWVASRIRRNGTILEDEYNQINVANVNLSYLKDPEAVESLKSLSTAITNARKKRGDEHMAQHVRDTQLRNALFSSAPNPVAIVSKDWRAMAFVAVQAGFSWFMNYRAIRSEVKLQYDQEMWRIEKDDMENITVFYNEMLNHQSGMVNKYNIDDMYRVTDQDFARLLDHLESNTGNDRDTYDFLVQNEKRYVLSAFYWYHRGVLARKLQRESEALKCFRTFQSIYVPFIRHDKMAALVAQGIIELLGRHGNTPEREEIERQMEIIEKNAQPEDWELHYFMAAIYQDFLNDNTKGELSIRKAITQLDFTFRAELEEYFKRLADKKKLPFGTKSDSVTNIPPSSENLMQCRMSLFQILAKADPSRLEAEFNRWWGRYPVSDFERLLMASFMAEPGQIQRLVAIPMDNAGGLIDGKGLSKEGGTTLIDDALAVDVEYDFNDWFRVNLPFRWAYAMPSNITFSIYVGDKEVFRGNEKNGKRRVLIEDKKPVLQIALDTKGAKKKVDSKTITGFSINFEHLTYTAKLYLRANLDGEALADTLSPYFAKCFRFYVTHQEQLASVLQKDPAPEMSEQDTESSHTPLEDWFLAQLATKMSSNGEEKNAYDEVVEKTLKHAFLTIAAGVQLVDSPTICSHIMPEKDVSAIDTAQSTIFAKIDNPQNEGLKEGRLKPFMISFESALDGSCTAIELPGPRLVPPATN